MSVDTGIDAKAFDNIVSAWDEAVQCEMATRAGHQCKRPATWYARLHDCEDALMCGQHWAAYRRSNEGRLPLCPVCNRLFSSVDVAIAATRL